MVDAFTSNEELRLFLFELDSALEPSLPSVSDSREGFSFAALKLLSARGYLGQDFFARLVTRFRMRARDVVEVAAPLIGETEADQLLAAVVKLTVLVPPGTADRAAPEASVENSVKAIASAFTLMGALAHESPEVASAITEYRLALRDTERNLSETEVYKGLHDAFHHLEHEGLLMMQLELEKRSDDPERARENRRHALECLKRALPTALRQLRKYLTRGVVDPGEAETIEYPVVNLERLVSAGLVAGAPAEPTERIEADMIDLLTSIPPQLDIYLSQAARRLQSNSLTTALEKIRQAALRDDPAGSRRIEALFTGAASLDRLLVQLGLFVREHSILQKIDGELRTQLLAGRSASIESAWNRVKSNLARLGLPTSPPLQDSWEWLAVLRKAVDDQITASANAPSDVLSRGAGEPRRVARDALVIEKLQAYYRTFAVVFCDVDSGLKELCDQFAKIRLPIDDLLRESEHS